jgi:hypothetical protein
LYTIRLGKEDLPPRVLLSMGAKTRPFANGEIEQAKSNLGGQPGTDAEIKQTVRTLRDTSWRCPNFVAKDRAEQKNQVHSARNDEERASTIAQSA